MRYVAIIDAGSTSSRLLLYSYEDIDIDGGDRYTTAIKFKKVKFDKDPESKHVPHPYFVA